jgi:hypothetical protein
MDQGSPKGSHYSHHNTMSADHLGAGILPNVLMKMHQKIESLTVFDSDILQLVANNNDPDSRESVKRSGQQSLSAAVLVPLAQKRYEQRRLVAMEIEKVVRSLVVQAHQQQGTTTTISNGGKMAGVISINSASPDMAMEWVHAILLLLLDDYVWSTSEDARKGGVVALAACAIGLKKANDLSPTVQECRDLILTSVVHACQDHSQRVRYYAAENLFNNVVEVVHRIEGHNLDIKKAIGEELNVSQRDKFLVEVQWI